MSRSRYNESADQPNPQPTQGNQVYGTAPQQVSPNTPNSSQTVSPVIIYAYPPQHGLQPQQAPGQPIQYVQQPQQAPPQPPQSYDNGGGCGRKAGPCGGRPRKRRLFKFLLFVGLIWFTAVMSYRHGGKVVKMMMIKKVAKEMDLSHQQRHQLRGIFWEAIQKNSKHRTTMYKIRNNFIKMLAKPKLTQKEVDAFLLKSTNDIQRIVLGNSKILFKAHNVLTPGQRYILVSRMQQFQRRRNRWKRRWHRRHAHHYNYHNTEAPRAAAAKIAKPVKAAKAIKAIKAPNAAKSALKAPKVTKAAQ